MATPVTMPMLGLTMEEGTVAEWLKQEGEAVQKDEPLLTVEMDKGTQEVPSPVAGVLRRIVVQAGTTVPVKTLIAEIGARTGIERQPIYMVNNVYAIFRAVDSGLGIAAPWCQGAYLENPNPAIERDRHHVAAFDLAACRSDPCAIDPHMTGGGKPCRGAAGAHNPRVP